MKGTLYLIPAALGENAPPESLPAMNFQTIRHIRCFIVEDVRSARRFLKKHMPDIVIDHLNFHLLNEHTPKEDIAGLLDALESGADAGLISEAGMPCIADPGAALVDLAHQAGITVKPLTGPSSIFLALAASGFNGQRFAFSGYLPVDKRDRTAKIRELENEAHQKEATQIFIETPYRNLQLLDSLLHNLKASTKLCIAVNLTQPDELIMSYPVNEWKKLKTPNIQKRPAVFLIGL